MTLRPMPGDVCLSIRQPFAWLVCAGLKWLENRRRPARYRGPVWIHASAALAVGFRSWRDLMGERLPAGADPAGPVEIDHPRLVLPAFASLARGAIVGRIVLVDCRPLARLTKADRQTVWAQGPFCWLLEDAEELAEPIPCAGRVGLWKWRNLS